MEHTNDWDIRIQFETTDGVLHPPDEDNEKDDIQWSDDFEVVGVDRGENLFDRKDIHLQEKEFPQITELKIEINDDSDEPRTFTETLKIEDIKTIYIGD